MRNPAAAQFVSGIEGAVVHYGSSTGFFGKKIIANGPGYLNAAVLYENMVIESYSAHPADLAADGGHLPEGGHVLERSSRWASSSANGSRPNAARRRAAVHRLSARARPSSTRALPHGFRPASVDVPVGAPIDAAHGVDPAQPKTTLPVPPVDVLNAVLAQFKEVKKPASVTLVLDISGSMNDEPQDRQRARRAGSSSSARWATATRFRCWFSNQAHAG